MNLLELRTAFVRQCGHMNLVGVQKYDSQTGLPDPDGDDVGPDYSVDNGADYYINRAMKQLSRNMLTPRTKQLRRYTPEVGQTVILDPDIPITLSAVTQGNELLPLLDAASILYYNENTETNARGPVRGYALGTLSMPTLTMPVEVFGKEYAVSRAWKYDGTSLNAKFRQLQPTRTAAQNSSFSSGVGEMLYVHVVEEDEGEELVLEIDTGDGWEAFGRYSAYAVLPAGGTILSPWYYRCTSGEVEVTDVEGPHAVVVELPHHVGRIPWRVYSSDASGHAWMPTPQAAFGGAMTPEWFPTELLSSPHGSRGTVTRLFVPTITFGATLEEQLTRSISVYFPSTGIFLTPPSDGTPVDVEGWFEPTPLTANTDANYWTVNHAELIIDAALVALGAQLHNPSVRILNDYTEAQQRLLRVTDIASEVNSIGNRFQ